MKRYFKVVGTRGNAAKEGEPPSRESKKGRREQDAVAARFEDSQDTSLQSGGCLSPQDQQPVHDKASSSQEHATRPSAPEGENPPETPDDDSAPGPAQEWRPQRPRKDKCGPVSASASSPVEHPTEARQSQRQCEGALPGTPPSLSPLAHHSLPPPSATSNKQGLSQPSLAIPAGHPLRFMTWNANSLLVRMRYNRDEVAAFITAFDPDYIALQEVRIPAVGKKGCPANQGEIKCDTKGAADERQFLLQCLGKPPFSAYRVWWSLGETKYGGTAVLIKRCFTPSAVAFSLDQVLSSGAATGPAFFRKKDAHEKDGRAILVEFPALSILNTYSPNNGFCRGCPKFQRRREWDAKVLAFLERRKEKQDPTPLIWCGDLNVSRSEDDVSHPEFFRTATKPGEPPAEDVDDQGQPGFSLGEQRRFEELLRRSGLCDAYRVFHRGKDMERGFTWSGNPVGKYQGKRMRVDYFLVDAVLRDRLVGCDIHGRGTQFEGFLGSDHCPVTMVLHPRL